MTPSTPWAAYQVLFELDEESGTWHFLVPELRITGGGGATLEEVAMDTDAAIAYELEADGASGARNPRLDTGVAIQCGVHLREDALWEVRCPCGWTSRRPFELRASAAKSRAWHLKTRHDAPSKGIYEAADGWRVRCLSCEFSSGPWPTRRAAGSSLGGHLGAQHTQVGVSHPEESQP